MNQILLKPQKGDMNFNWLDLFDKLVKNIVLIVGAWLAYRKFFKGRAYKRV